MSNEQFLIQVVDKVVTVSGQTPAGIIFNGTYNSNLDHVGLFDDQTQILWKGNRFFRQPHTQMGDAFTISATPSYELSRRSGDFKSGVIQVKSYDSALNVWVFDILSSSGLTQLLSASSEILVDIRPRNDLSSGSTVNNTTITSNTSRIVVLENDTTLLNQRQTISETNITNLTSSVLTINNKDIQQDSRLDVLEGQTAVNTSAIDDNASAVSTNATAITSLDVRLTTVEGTITANTSAIDGNTSNITNNAFAISVNALDISAQDTRLATVEAGISVHTSAIDTNTTAIAGNSTAIATLTTRVTAEEEATAQAILRDGGLSFERCITDLAPDIIMTSQNVFPTDINNIFSSTIGVVVNNGSVLGGASVLTNPVGKRSLRLPHNNTLKWHTPNVSFSYNTGCTFAVMLGDLKYDPPTDWVEYFMMSHMASPPYNSTDRYLYGGGQSNFSINGDIYYAPLLPTPELETYSTGVYHMIIFRFLGDKAEMFIKRNGRAATPDINLTNMAFTVRPAVNYFAINGGGPFTSRTGITEFVGVYQWARALTDYEIDYLRVTSNGYTDPMNYIPMTPPTYPKIRMMGMYTPSSSQVEPDVGTAIFQLTTRTWVLGTGSSIGGTLNASNGIITLTKVGRDSSTATVRCRISASTSRADNKDVRLNQLIFINGTELLVPGGVNIDTASFKTSCMVTAIVNLKKGDTIQLRYQSRYTAGGNAKDLIFNRAVLLIEEL